MPENIKEKLGASIKVNKDKEKALLIENIENPSNLTFDIKGLNFNLFSTDNPTNFSFEFEPIEGEQERVISMKYNGEQVSGTPLIVRERAPSVKHDFQQKMITLTNVSDPNLIDIESERTMTYDVHEDKNDPRKYHLMYSNPGDYKNNIYLKFNGKRIMNRPITIGSKEPLKAGTLIFTNQTGLKPYGHVERNDQPTPNDSYALPDASIANNQLVNDHDPISNANGNVSFQPNTIGLTGGEFGAEGSNSSPTDENNDQLPRVYTQADVGKVVHPRLGKLVHVHNPAEGQISYINTKLAPEKTSTYSSQAKKAEPQKINVMEI